MKDPLLRQSEWGALNICLSWAYEGPVPGEGHGRRRNYELVAWLLRKGTVRVAMEGGGEAKGEAGSWLIVPPGWRDQQFSADARILSLSWRARWLDGRPLFQSGLPISLPAADHPGLEPAARRLVRFASANLPASSDQFRWLEGGVRVPAKVFIRGEILLWDWIGRLTDSLQRAGLFPEVQEVEDNRVLKAMEILDTLPLDQNMAVGTVAQQVGLSESQLNRLFVRHAGCPPKAYFQQRRLSAARHFLETGKRSIKEIAYLVGFSSQSTFYNWFRKHEGMKPSDVATGFLEGPD